MSIRFSCSCGRKLKVSDEKIGMKVLCSSCGATLKVPKKSQDAYWHDVPVKSDETKIDYIGGVKDFIVQFVPGAIVVALMVYFAYYLSSQIIVGRGNLPDLGRVRGKVTIDGTPLAGATVRFIPLEEGSDKERKGASVSLGLSDSEGKYTLLYVKDTPGAALGQSRIEIEAKDERNGRELVRPEFNTQSTLRQEVKSGSQELNFEVKGFNAPRPAESTNP